MKKFLFYLLTLGVLLYGCTSTKNESNGIEKKISQDVNKKKDIKKEQESDNTKKKIINEGWISFDNTPEEVVALMTELKTTLENNSGLNFVLNDIVIKKDFNVGKSYDIMYYATTFDGNKTVPGFKSFQLRMLIDFNDYRLSDICIIVPVEGKTDLHYEIYYNQLYPAFMALDFNTLFDNRAYRRTKLSDDDVHSKNLFYTEYMVDYTEGLF